MSKSIRNTKGVLLISLGLVALSSCRDDGEQDSTVSQPEAVSTTTDCSDNNAPQLTYYKDIKPIMEAYCVSCHDAEAGLGAGKGTMAFTTYSGARDWAYIMPGFRLFAELSEADQNTIQTWIDTGLTEDFYDSDVKTVLDNNCISCHEDEAPTRKDKPTTDFTRAAVVRLHGSRMPSFGKLKQLPADEQRILEEWVNQGLPLGEPE